MRQSTEQEDAVLEFLYEQAVTGVKWKDENRKNYFFPLVIPISC
jgi:hypothetical protein